MSDLIFREGFWVRHDNIEQDLVVIRDVFQGDAYRTALLGCDAFHVLIDIGAHIGTFAALWHVKNPSARIACIEACPENIPALQKNVGHFAEVIHAACTYQAKPLALLNAVRPRCESTGGSMVVPLDEIDTAPGQPGYHYWRDTRPLPAITLEEIMARLEVDHIDLLKLDCEGSEIDILGNTPSRERIRFVVGEYHNRTAWDAFRTRVFRHWDYGHMFACPATGRGLFHLANRVWPPRPGSSERHKVIRVAVPAGIGDSCWCLVKLAALLRREGADAAVVDAEETPLPRTREFLEHFDFVACSGYTPWHITEADPHVLPDGTYNYAPSQPGWHGEFDWMLQANGHLERGARLADWLPELEPEWDFARRFRFQPDEQATAHVFAHEVGTPYVVMFAASETANTSCGHNRGPLWTPREWAVLCDRFLKDGVRPVFVGAEWDRSYFERRLRPLLPSAVLDRIAPWPIGTTFAVIKRSAGVIAFQSGLGIFAVYLGVPCAMWWRPDGDSIHPERFISFREAMASGWAPPGAVETGRYLPLVYGRCSPESIHSHAQARWY
jgi:FkbM family methyltransferase